VWLVELYFLEVIRLGSAPIVAEQLLRFALSGEGNMFWRRPGKTDLCTSSDADARRRFDHAERKGREILGRVSSLKAMGPDDLPAAVLVLYHDAKHQAEAIRQSIKERADHNFDSDGEPGADLATFLAATITEALRNVVSTPQKLRQATRDAVPDLDFAIHKLDAVSLVSATLREQRVEGVLEGLRIAGVLTRTRSAKGS
jgi:hypothetical protein